MTSEQRHINRYNRRRMKREQKKQDRSNRIGGIEKALSFNELYKAGKKCCNGVRWKNSVQRFELHLFSGTAIRHKEIINQKWLPAPYVHFTLCERGKTRPIDAPRIQDRQIHKAYTKNVLLPLYQPSMIWNNGASLQNKGFHFSLRMLKKDLSYHFRRYNREGYIILIDFKKFFPSAPHKEIYKRHNELILNDDLRVFGDRIVASIKGDIGMPLGVEPSQAEMIALPSSLDNYIKCQLSIKGFGHYMDDYYLIVPPNKNPKELMQLFINKATSIGLTVNMDKSKIVRLSKSFKFCKAKFTLTETGKIVVNGNRDGMKRARRKIKTFKDKIDNREMTYEDLWTSVNGMLAYFENYNDHTKVLKLRRLFYSLFGFSPERIENFRKKEKDEIHSTQTI